MKDKSEVSSLLPQFQKMIFTQFGAKIKWFCLDNAKDYSNQNLSSFFIKDGIIHESSCIETPQQNEVAE